MVIWITIRVELNALNEDDFKRILKELRKEMLNSASELKFEKAAELRDEIKKLENEELGIN